MALARRYPKPIQEQPSWKEILTADPVQPPKKVTQLTMIFLAVLAISIFFALCVVVFQPLILLLHQTPYPNLAATSLSSVILTSGLLGLLALSIVYIFLRPYLWLLKIALKSLSGFIGLVMVGLFFLLLFSEIGRWVFYNVQIQLYWESFKIFYLGLLGL